MNSIKRVLVTGAAGRLGKHVCRALLTRDYDVRATDQRFVAQFPVRIELGDLRDEHFVYRALEGCDAVVHLGNHPNPWCGPTPQRLLSENVAMNANVFFAATDLGVRHIVFSSSIQVILRSAGTHGAACTVPYLPLDGLVPPDPGTNTYALSKEHGERLLRLLCERDAGLAATALRLPMLPPEPWLRRAAGKVPREMLNWGDCLTYLLLPDAAELIVAVLERSAPGYHQYLPARSFAIRGQSLQAVVAENYAHVPLRVPVEGLSSLVDLAQLEAELGWRPPAALEVELASEDAT